MTELYLGVMDALWEMTPGLPLFFVEGGGQGGYKGAPTRRRLSAPPRRLCRATGSPPLGSLPLRRCPHPPSCTRKQTTNTPGLNWGNGFITDKKLIASLDGDWTTRISDAGPFFEALIKRPYADRVVLSPHVYVRGC